MLRSVGCAVNFCFVLVGVEPCGEQVAHIQEEQGEVSISPGADVERGVGPSPRRRCPRRPAPFLFYRCVADLGVGSYSPAVGMGEWSRKRCGSECLMWMGCGVAGIA